MLSHLHSIASIRRRRLLRSPITHFFAQRGRVNSSALRASFRRTLKTSFHKKKFTLYSLLVEVEIGFGVQKEARKREEGRKEERRIGRPTTQWSRDLWGSPSPSPLALLPAFHTLVFKILAQWSFLSESALVVPII